MVTQIQAILIALIAALTWLDGAWLGEMKFREPIVTGALVGLVMGDIRSGVLIGAQLQLIWMGAVNIGPTAQLDIGTGGTIGAAVAIATGTGAETAILFGLPISVLMQFINTLLMSAYSGAMLIADKGIEEVSFKKVNIVHYICGFISFASYFIFTYLLMVLGGDVMNGIVNSLPNWVLAGLNGVAAILPGLGFALLMGIIMDRSLIPYFIVGFIPMAFIGHDLSMVGIVAIAISIAAIIFMLHKNLNIQNSMQKDVTIVNEWED